MVANVGCSDSGGASQGASGRLSSNYSPFDGSMDEPGSSADGDAGGPAEGLRIASVQSLSTDAFPGHLAAVVYCDDGNSIESAERNFGPVYSWKAVEYFLGRWRSVLTGIAFAGSEPLAQPAIAGAISRCRQLGFSVAVHTRGQCPSRLSELGGMFDWVSLDLQPPLLDAHHDMLAELGMEARTTLDALVRERLPFECRLTVEWGVAETQAICGLARELAAAGVEHLTLMMDSSALLSGRAPRHRIVSDEIALWRQLEGLFASFRVRHAFLGPT